MAFPVEENKTRDVSPPNHVNYPLGAASPRFKEHTGLRAGEEKGQTDYGPAARMWPAFLSEESLRNGC